LDFIQLIILGLVQGLTEFLPISSSAHLILVPEFTGWEDQGLVNDIAVHLGSLLAVVIYLRRDLKQIFSAWFSSLSGNGQTPESLLFWYVALGSIPIAIAGYLMRDIADTYFRSPVIIAIATILFGLVLWWADKVSKRLRNMQDLRIRDALLIGLAQILAIVPGTSRSGITMTAGLMLGLDRNTAARFSFLLSIPTILMAGGYEGLRYLLDGAPTDWGDFFILACISAVSAWFAIHYFLKLLERTGMLPYVIYRIVLGLFLVFVFV
jgi:undecaprenyl-diphosphatase